jgi:signal transduction histidine kinase
MDSFDANTVTDCLFEPVFAVSTDENIVFVNSRLLEITQASQDTAIGSDVSWLEQFVADGFDRLRYTITSVSRGETEDQRVELVMRHPPSAPVPRQLTAQARVAPLVRDGERIGALVTLRDMTDQKERQQKLERQNKRPDKFASLVSHDLRNPLNIASLQLKLAREESDSTYLADVEDALARMEDLITDLLSIAHEGTLVQETEPVQLSEVAEGCIGVVPSESATLEIETEQSLHANPSRLKQLLENLIRNAVEHGGDDVIITLGDHPDGFYLADNGPGIPRDKHSEVFDAGYSTTDDGTGFGLNIVQEIAEAHGWEIQIISSSSGGARFEITGVERTGRDRVSTAD